MNNIDNTLLDDLKLINRYTRRELSLDEVYIFNVILCDNEVDRDYEAFSLNSLNKLAELFLGKTGIFDHNPKGSNQTARIFDTQVITDNSKFTKYGQAYSYIKAKAYMIKSDKNKDLILDIDAGIKKEVSVGCSVKDKICSICGTNLKNDFCDHNLGEYYNNKLCFAILDNPTDAYEWSFVAVPAQINAGVTKSFNNDFYDLDNILKTSKKSITLSRKEIDLVVNKLNEYKKLALNGEIYKNEIKKDIISSLYLSDINFDSKIFSDICDKLSVDELKELKKFFEKQVVEKNLINNSQLVEKKENNNNKNFDFKI